MTGVLGELTPDGDRAMVSQMACKENSYCKRSVGRLSGAAARGRHARGRPGRRRGRRRASASIDEAARWSRLASCSSLSTSRRLLDSTCLCSSSGCSLHRCSNSTLLPSEATSAPMVKRPCDLATRAHGTSLPSCAGRLQMRWRLGSRTPPRPWSCRARDEAGRRAYSCPSGFRR